MASLYNIHLRTGCFCNTGACQRHLGISDEMVKKHLQVGNAAHLQWWPLHPGGWSRVWGQRSQSPMNWILLKKREEDPVTPALWVTDLGSALGQVVGLRSDGSWVAPLGEFRGLLAFLSPPPSRSTQPAFGFCSGVGWPFVYLFLKNVYSNLLSIFNSILC